MWRRSRAEQSAQAAEVAAVRLARANSADEDLPICTIFDPVRQYELTETSACRSSSRLLDFALSKARHLGLDPDGRVLNHPLPGLPRPQVCIHSVVHANYVVLPVDLGSGHFCTLAMERSASAFELFLHLEAVCGAPRAHRSLLAKGWLTLAVNGLPVEDPFAKDALILADSARLLKAPEADPGLAADRLRPERARPSTREGCLTIHRPAAPPVHLYVSPFATPADVHTTLQAQGLCGAQGLALPLDFSPVQFSNGAHFLALEAHHLRTSQPWYVFDLRRVTHPPLVTFWALPQPPCSSLPHLVDLLLHEFPDLDPIISVYSGAFQCKSALRGSKARASLVTVVGVPLDSLRTGCPPAPAVFRSDEALMLRPGFLASALREPKAR